ncbi:hypothetical protein VNI00_015869 [Paramarasmius palmivorus]|uniref:Uncharacterized protein n=1 Tax=Paramarasmius palmivorus TaxID=297713 RepID=A0AAW0BIW5_9AGAR
MIRSTRTYSCNVCGKYSGCTIKGLRGHQALTACGDVVKARNAQADPNQFTSHRTQIEDLPPFPDPVEPTFAGAADDFHSAEGSRTSNKRRRVTVEEVEDEGDPPRLSRASFVSLDFTGAGSPVEGHAPNETSFERLQRERKEQGQDMWTPFKDREEWELARWLMLSGVSQGQVDTFSKLPIIQKRVKPTFRNKQTFFKLIDELPSVRGGWTCENLEVVGDIMKIDAKGNEVPMTETLELWMRNPVECIKELMQDTRFKEHLHYTPEKMYTSEQLDQRAVDEMWTGDWWWATQSASPQNVEQKLLPKGSTIAAVILASDETQLSTFSGDKKAWPVYLTLGNLPGSVRRKPSEQASILIGYIPVSKLECFSRSRRSLEGYRLFHDCMGKLLESLARAGNPLKGGVEMLCADGYVRAVYPLLAAYIADYPEQCLVAGCKENRCPKCLSHSDRLGDPLHSVLRDPGQTMAALKASANGNDESVDQWGIRKITPFWAHLPLCNIFHCFTPDILHQLHKGVFKDHLVKWSTDSLPHEKQSQRRNEIDVRFQSMPRHVKLRHFRRGISLVSQWTGNEYKNMEKVFLGVLSGAAPVEVVSCVRAVLDFIYYSQFQLHTDDTLSKMEDSLRRFHETKEAAFVDTNIREDFNIPKIHSMNHYVPMIRSHGVAIGFNSEWSERLHIDFAKEAYRASSKKDYTKQMAKWLDRREAIHNFERFLSWALDEEISDIGGEDSEEDETVDMEEQFKETADAVEENCSTLPSTMTRVDARGIALHPRESFCSFAKRPPLHLSIDTLESQYGCDRFVYCLEAFLVERNMRAQDYWNTKPGFYEVYKRLQIIPPHFPEAGNDSKYETIRATPSFQRNKGYVPSHFDTVLARKSLHDVTGLKGAFDLVDNGL